MHNLMGVYHILCTHELDAHIVAEGACKQGDHKCLYVEIVGQHAPIADQLPATATFIFDLIYRTVTNEEGKMCETRMKAHIFEAAKLQAMLTSEIQAGMLTERSGLQQEPKIHLQHGSTP